MRVVVFSMSYALDTNDFKRCMSIYSWIKVLNQPMYNLYVKVEIISNCTNTPHDIKVRIPSAPK